MNKIRYFDHAATTAVSEEVLKEMLPYFSIEYGNPSSIYSIGRNAKRAIEEARLRVALAINSNTKEIYFTGCGSESDNISLKGVAYANKEKGNHIITTKIEHPAILNTCKSLEKEGFNVGMENNKFIILNTELTRELILEGLAREIVSKVQNIRKTNGFEIADRINLYYDGDNEIVEALEMFKDYIKEETLSVEVTREAKGEVVDINGHDVNIYIEKN